MNAERLTVALFRSGEGVHDRLLEYLRHYLGLDTQPGDYFRTADRRGHPGAFGRVGRVGS